MFNGIIYNSGSVEKISSSKNSLEIVLKTNLSFKKSELGASLCCNGACLTITKINKNLISFYLSKETLNKTNFKYIKIGNIINVENSLNYGNKISGHYVQGHTDTTGRVVNTTILNKTWIVMFEINIIPHTLKLTNLIKLKKYDKVNIEFDIFSKYLVDLKK